MQINGKIVKISRFCVPYTNLEMYLEFIVDVVGKEFLLGILMVLWRSCRP